MLCLDHAICSRDIKVTSYWSTNRLQIFQYFEFEFLFTFENDTVEKFETFVPNFLDSEIHPTGIPIYRKETHTAQYINFNRLEK